MDNLKPAETTTTTATGAAASAPAKRPSQEPEVKQQPPDRLERTSGRLKQTLVMTLFIVGLIVCVTSIAFLLLLPTIVSNELAKRLVLKNNSLLLERWSKPNVPMYFKVWLFDVKNAREVLEKRGTKPEVQEVGPFVFNLRRQKDVISFAGDNLYYTERKLYHFNRELSCCAINTTVTLPNVPLVAVVDRALGYQLPLVGRFIPRLINRAIQSLREQLFVRKQVRELLFDGYEVDLLKMVSRIGSLIGLPQQSQKFALLKGRNDTWRPEQDGVWAINTGARERRLFGKVASWNSYKQLPFWPAAQCNAINGSDGTLFPPPIKRSEPLYIFNNELCRTVNLIYDRPSDVRSIKAYRFVLNPLNFAHTKSPGPPVQQEVVAAARGPLSAAQAKPATLASRSTPLAAAASEATARQTVVAPPAGQSPRLRQQTGVGGGQQQERLAKAAQEALAPAQERPRESRANPNRCFCDRKLTNLNGVNVCEFDGLIDLSKCSKQAQVVFGSAPHFSGADPRLARQVLGLRPNATRHTTFLDIEPNTGLVLGGKRRVQLNLIIKHNNEVDGFENINDMLVPLIWFEESAIIPEESARKFKSMYTERIRLVNMGLLSLLLASIALLLIDARLLMTTNYWRQLKLSLAAPEQVATAGTGAGRQSRRRSEHDPAAGQLGRRPRTLADGASSLTKRSDSPLLTHGDEDEDDDDDGAYSESSSSSPELNKWSAARQLGPGEPVRPIKLYLGRSSNANGGNSNGDGSIHSSSIQIQSQPTAAGQRRQPDDGNSAKSIVEINSSQRRSSEPEVPADH